MCEFRLNPDIKECLITHIECNDKEVVIWSQSEIKEVFNFEAIMQLNYREMFSQFFNRNRLTLKPIEGKYYVFCDKFNLQFYRVLVRSVVDNKSLVQFIDFGYEELVSIDNLFVYQNLFINCKSLAQKFILSHIRPKNTIKGFNSEKVVKSLQKFVDLVLIFHIFDENKIQVFDTNGEQIIKTFLQNFEDIETNDLMAIEFGDTSSSNELIDVKSVETIDNKLDDESIESDLKTLFGSKHLIFISKTFSEKSIFVHLRQNSNLIQELNQTLQDVYKNAIKEDLYALNVSDIGPNSVIAVQYSEDLCWYRARVLQIKKKKLKVFYIDFGNSEVIQLNFCRQLLPQFLRLSPLAIHCFPLNENLGSDDLEVMEIQEHQIECHFQTLKDDKKTMEVLLYDNGVLISRNSNKSSPKTETKEEDNKKTQFLSTIPIMTANKETKEEDNKKTIEIPDNGILMSAKKTIEVPLMTKKTKEEELSRDLMRRSEDFFLSLIGLTDSVLISRAENSQTLFCYLLESKKSLNLLVLNMTQYYRNSGETLQLDHVIGLEEKEIIIAVYYDLEDKWLRAIVKHVITEQEISVFCLDFGLNLSIKLSDCRQLTEQFFNEKIISFKCRPLNDKLKYYELKTIESNETPINIKFVDKNKENVFQIQIISY